VLRARFGWLIILTLLLPWNFSIAADSGFLVVGLEQRSLQWQLYRQLANNEWVLVATDDEPRTPDYHPISNRLVYADSVGSIRIVESNSERTLFESDPAYKLTQPVFSSDGDLVYMVALKDGNSVDTDIVVGNITTGEVSPVVLQRSAQFEPFVSDDYILYSSVSCVPPACHRIIEDIWKIQPVSREAEQLSNFNVISREPVFNGENVFVISDLTGRFRLHKLQDGTSVPLSSGDVIDSSPGITNRGDVVFIQRKRNAPDVIKQWQRDSGDLLDIKGPAGILKLRDLDAW